MAEWLNMPWGTREWRLDRAVKAWKQWQDRQCLAVFFSGEAAKFEVSAHSHRCLITRIFWRMKESARRNTLPCTQLKDTAAIADASKKWTRTQNSRLLMIITVGVGTCDKRSEFGAVIRVSKRIQESVTEFLPVRNGEAIFSDSATLACSIFEYKR